MNHREPRLVRILCVFAVLLLAGCATAPPGTLDDPFERTNRAVFAFNNKVNDYVTLPIAWLYLKKLPGGVRKGVNAALANLQSPVTFANDLLQGRVRGAGETALRFVVNSVAGLGGIHDVAAENGLPFHKSDFGQTLSVYGIGSGPFLVLPVIGPSTPRDTLGAAVDFLADPLIYLPPEWSLSTRIGVAVGVHILSPFEENARAIVFRNQLGGESVDPYGTMRSVYRQRRAREIEGGPPPVPDLPE